MSLHSSQSQIKVKGEQDASQFDWQPAVSGVISAALCPAGKCGQTSCYASQSDVRTCSDSDDTWRYVAITSCDLTVNQSGVRQPRCQVWCMKNALLLVQVQSHAQLDVKLQLRSMHSLKLLKKRDRNTWFILIHSEEHECLNKVSEYLIFKVFSGNKWTK